MSHNKLFYNADEIKVGMEVYVRDYLVDGNIYGNYSWQKGMRTGWNTVVLNNDGELRLAYDDDYYYDLEMLDWDKTWTRFHEEMSYSDSSVGVSVLPNGHPNNQIRSIPKMEDIHHLVSTLSLAKEDGIIKSFNVDESGVITIKPRNV